MNETRVSEDLQVADLVEEWLDWSQAAELLRVSVSKVRQLIREHQLAACVPGPGRAASRCRRP